MECKRCHTAITMFWWPVSFSGDWEDHFYLCDECMHDLIEFMRKERIVDPVEAMKAESEPEEKESFDQWMDCSRKTCPFCGATGYLVDVPRSIYECPTCRKRFDRYGKEVPQ